MYAWVTDFYLIGLLISVLCLLLVIYQKPCVEQGVAAIIMICGGLIWLGYYVRYTADSMGQIMIGTKLNYVGGTAVFYFVVLFCIKYYRLKRVIILKHILTAVTLFFLFVTTTFDQNQLYYTSYRLDTSGPFPELVKEYTFLHTLYTVTIAVYCLLAITITILEMRKKSKISINKSSKILLLLTVLIPGACYVAEKVMDPVLDFLPFALLISELFILYLLGTGKIYDVNTLVRDYVFDSIDEAIIVVDRTYRYRESNKEALDIFPVLNNASVGDSIDHISQEIYDLFMLPVQKEGHIIEKNDRIFKSRVNKVIDKNTIGGFVLWLQDVTAQQQNIRLLTNYREDLVHEVDKKTAQLQRLQEQMINGFSALVENKDFITGGHIQRTSAYVDALSRELRNEGIYLSILTPSFCQKLKLVAPLHDIGKISIPDDILDKPAKLTPEEFEIIKTHSETGAKIISKIMPDHDDIEYMQTAENVARYHHEKWNGKGYPAGLLGEDIPLAARIMAIADVFDALVSERPYKPAFTINEAFSIIESESGEHFDPQIVKAFLNIKQDIMKLHETFDVIQSNVASSETVQTTPSDIAK